MIITSFIYYVLIIFWWKYKPKKKAKIKYTAKQLGDVVGTNANNKKLKRIINYKPSTKIEEGIRKYLKWFGDYE